MNGVFFYRTVYHPLKDEELLSLTTYNVHVFNTVIIISDGPLKCSIDT